jgi:hypothetical protein
MKDWVRPVGLAHRDSDPTELFECPACGKQVEFAVEPEARPARRVAGVVLPPTAQPSPALCNAEPLEAAAT